MSNDGAAPRAATSAPAAPRRAAAPASSARAEASRKNGAMSRGPKTPEGKSRSAQNALKHGMCAHKHVLLPQEDAAEFRALETAILAELAPEGALQTLLARRIVMAAWRLARADRMEAEALEVRCYEGANPGIALIRDGNGTRAFETLMRYRGAAMAEFTRALRTLKALQAEQAERHAAGAEVTPMPPRQPRVPAGPAARLAMPPRQSRVPARPAARLVMPNEPERQPLSQYVVPDQPGLGRTLQEPAASWTPNEPEPGRLSTK